MGFNLKKVCGIVAAVIVILLVAVIAALILVLVLYRDPGETAKVKSSNVGHVVPDGMMRGT